MLDINMSDPFLVQQKDAFVLLIQEELKISIQSLDLFFADLIKS